MVKSSPATRAEPALVHLLERDWATRDHPRGCGQGLLGGGGWIFVAGDRGEFESRKVLKVGYAD